MIGGVIMAHRKREAWAEELSDQLGFPVVWDRVNDRHETGLRCLQAGISSDATHHVVIQDDAIVCRDLIAGLEQAVQTSDDRLVGLYVGNVRPHAATVGKKVDEAQRAGRSWVAMNGPMWGVGIVVPTVHLPALVAHYSKSREQNYDRRIERWATAAKVECWYTIPSLVEHRSGEENPSLVPGRPSLTRRARVFIGADASALDVDWSLTPPPTVEFWRQVGTNRVTRTPPGSNQARRLEASPQWEQVVEARCGECGSKKYEPLVEAQTA